MFYSLYSIFNYSKLLSWFTLFYINYKIYGKCNLNILQIILNNIQKTSAIGTKCIQKITPYLKMGECDKEIINILNLTYENNKYHDDKFTEKSFYNDFGINLYDKYEIVERVSSGSIGQVYKVRGLKDNKFYAMKVVHPNIDHQLRFIKKVIKVFNLNRYVFFELNNFIKNYEKETNLIHEAYNMKIFHNHYKDNNRIIIPKLYDFSQNIIIMEYIEGENIEELSAYERAKYLTLVFIFSNNNKTLLNFNHGDMHFGNFKKCGLDKIVIYDFGFCFDVIDMDTVYNLDDCWHSMLSHKEAKNSLKQCLENIIKYHLEIEDIEKYGDIIDEIFLQQKITDLEILFNKIYTFFKRIDVKIKMEFLNLMVIYLHTGQYDECEMQDLLTFCLYYDIFHEYQEKVKKDMYYRGANLSKYTKNKNIEDDLKKLL